MKNAIRIARWASLPIAGVQIVVWFVYPWLTGRFDDQSQHEVLRNLAGLFIVLVLALSFIWCGDYVGWFVVRFVSLLPIPNVGEGANKFLSCFFIAIGWLVLLMPIFVLALALWLSSQQ